MTEVTCIYCSVVVDLNKGQGDHVISAALGRFEGEFIFRRICYSCNNLIGKCEESLLRCAPESFVRRIVKPTVKRNSRGTNWVGAYGMPPPCFTIDHGDHHELVTASNEDPRNVTAIDQLVIVDKEKRERHIRLFPEMTLDKLRNSIDALSIGPSDQMYLHADQASWPHYVALLHEIRPSITIEERESTEAGIHKRKVRITFKIHADYWRAIAKIGFHYYLLNSRRGVRGDEPEFARIRDFIMVGGNHDSFFKDPATQFGLPFRELPEGNPILPAEWIHVLAADEASKAAVAMVSLFMGPQRLAPTYHINLGQFQSQLVVPGARWAHAYIYDTNSPRSGFAGRVVAKTLTKLR